MLKTFGMAIVAIGLLLAITTAGADDLTLDLGNKVTMKLVQIPAGKFMMGSPETEKDRDKSEALHEVTISKPFYIGKYEVTQQQWTAVMLSNPSRQKGENHPVESVTWDECQTFCRKIGEKTGKTVRLPTEAEWEYACRAGGQKRYGYGDSDEVFAWYAWYGDDGGHHPVGQKKPNAWDLYDMHGNVAEWCQDWYAATSKVGAETDPTGPSAGTLHVTRGGSSVHFQGNCRAASRGKNNPASRSYLTGMRVVIVSEDSAKTPSGSQPLAAKPVPASPTPIPTSAPHTPISHKQAASQGKKPTSKETETNILLTAQEKTHTVFSSGYLLNINARFIPNDGSGGFKHPVVFCDFSRPAVTCLPDARAQSDAIVSAVAAKNTAWLKSLAELTYYTLTTDIPGTPSSGKPIVNGVDVTTKLLIVLVPSKSLTLTSSKIVDPITFEPGTIKTRQALVAKFGLPTDKEDWNFPTCKEFGLAGTVFWWGSVGVGIAENDTITHLLVRRPVDYVSEQPRKIK